jgi:hypothetical protein
MKIVECISKIGAIMLNDRDAKYLQVKREDGFPFLILFSKVNTSIGSWKN